MAPSGGPIQARIARFATHPKNNPYFITHYNHRTAAKLTTQYTRTGLLFFRILILKINVC